MLSSVSLDRALFAVLLSTADLTADAISKHYTSDSSQDLDEELAWVAAHHVDRVLRLYDWPDLTVATLSVAVHELVEWVARMREIELTGTYIARDTLTWLPADGYKYGSRRYDLVVQQRYELLLHELAEDDVIIASEEVA